MDDPSQAVAENDSKNSVPKWVQATLADIRDLDFEGPIADAMTAEPEELSTLYREAADLHEELDDGDAAPAARVFAMLASIMGLHFKPEDRHEPYGAMFISSEGRRSALPEDFRGEPATVLAYAAERADNPVLKARLSDLTWLLDRSQVELGRAAVAAYVDIIEKLETGVLRAGFEKDDGESGLTGRDILRRALQIGRMTGGDDAAIVTARERVVTFRKRAIDRANFVRAHWFAEMDLDFGISEPAEVATELEKLLRGTAVGEDATTILSYGGLRRALITMRKMKRESTAARPKQPKAWSPLLKLR